MLKNKTKHKSQHTQTPSNCAFGIILSPNLHLCYINTWSPERHEVTQTHVLYISVSTYTYGSLPRGCVEMKFMAWWVVFFFYRMICFVKRSGLIVCSQWTIKLSCSCEVVTNVLKENRSQRFFFNKIFTFMCIKMAIKPSRKRIKLLFSFIHHSVTTERQETTWTGTEFSLRLWQQCCFFFFPSINISWKVNIASVYKPVEQRERCCKNDEDDEKLLTRAVDLIQPVGSSSRYSDCGIRTRMDQCLRIFTHTPHKMLHHQQYCCDVTPKTTREETVQDKRGWEQTK